MIAYEPELWHDLYVAVAGAAAALAGLIFVAVSINLDHILKEPGLPPLAGKSLTILLGLLLLSILILTPGQPSPVLGSEILALGLMLACGAMIASVRGRVASVRLVWTLQSLALALASTVPMVVMGLSLLLGAGGGLYWGVAELLLGFAVSIYNAWILLIEILR